MKKIAMIVSILIVAFSCKKQEIKADYDNNANKLVGYYKGTTEQYDTLTINGASIPIKYMCYINFFLQKNKTSALEIAYSSNVNAYNSGVYYSGSGEVKGLIESIILSKENVFYINETTVDFWGRPISLKGNGTYDETNHSLILNLEANDNSKIRQLTLKLIRQKRLGDD